MPVVASYCTTFLKPEMRHIYRQVTGLRRYRTFVLARERLCATEFPFDDIEMIPKPPSNFVRRFWLKYIRQVPPLVYRGEAKMLERIFARRHADLMHIYFGHTGVHLLDFIKAWDRPTVVSFHGADVMQRPEQPEYAAQLRELLETVPLVLARSDSLAKRLVEIGCPAEKVRINRTGIPLEDFPFRQRLMPADGEWQFVQACRLIPKKGIKTALRAFALFRAQYPKARFVIAGEGPMQGEIDALARELRLDGAVELCGFLTQKDLCALFHQSHVFIHPSEVTSDQNQEGVPNSMLEAMASGLPVLATLHGGIPEAVTDAGTGFLVPEKDHEALFRAMCDITASLDHLAVMGRAASQSVRETFEQSAQIARLESYYDEALKPFAYLFERFPSYTQTFVCREAEAVLRLGVNARMFSIRSPDEKLAADFPAELASKITYLPPGDDVISLMKGRSDEGGLPKKIARALREWETKTDRKRLFEAAYIGAILRREKIRHVHAHFAGMAARTAFWIKDLHGIRYSFTGHANDIFAPGEFPVSLEDLIREAAFVITETDFSRDWLRAKFPAHAAKIHRVYNGIDSSRFQPGEPPAGPPRILSVGRLIEKKGFGDLIEACRILKERGLNFECAIVGDGPLEGALREQIGRSGLEGIVLLAGPLTQAELAPMLRAATLFALACMHEADGGMDNLPTVIMEAMVCALPVVATRVGGVPEMVTEGESGYLVREKSPAEFADAIARVLADPAQARSLGKQGREIALAKFSVEVSARQLKALIERVTERG